jgi:hypothetical protein
MPDDATPLIPSDITYRRELNKAEQENIARAQDWALSRRRELLTEKIHQGSAPPHVRRCMAIGREFPNHRAEHRGLPIVRFQWRCAISRGHEGVDRTQTQDFGRDDQLKTANSAIRPTFSDSLNRHAAGRNARVLRFQAGVSRAPALPYRPA